MSQTSLSAFLSFILGLLVSSCTVSSKPQQVPQPLQVGYNLGVKNITPEKMAYAKSVGIDYVETSFSAYVDKDRNFLASDEEILEQVKKAKAAADQAGIVIWSIHMPFGKDIDIAAMREIPVHMVIGSEDTETWEIRLTPEDSWWMDGAERLAEANRLQRNLTLEMATGSGIPPRRRKRRIWRPAF